MLIGQVGENCTIDLVFDKAVDVLGHAELSEPIRHSLHVGHRRSRRRLGEFSDHGDKDFTLVSARWHVP